MISGKSFDDYVKMAEEYRNRKSSNNNSSIDSFLCNHSVTSAKQNAVADVTNDKQFEVSPFKPAVDELVVKTKIVEALSRLENGNGAGDVYQVIQPLNQWKGKGFHLKAKRMTMR